MTLGSGVSGSAPALADRTAMLPRISGSPHSFPDVYVQGKKETELDMGREKLQVN